MLIRFIEKKWQSLHAWSHAGVAAGYALVYLMIAGTLSSAPWPFAAGLRITCLLLVPYRYWPALALGEVVPLAYLNLGHAGDWGATWVFLASIPPIVLAMPVIWWFRERAALFPARDLVDVKKLLCCVLALSLLWASTRYAALLTVQLANGPYHVKTGTAFSFFINFYMVLLLVTPWVVMFRIHLHGLPRVSAWKTIVKSAAARDAFIAVLSFAVLAVLHQLVSESIKPAVMLVLFFPIIGLTLKHGWRASVLGGTLCLVSVSLLVRLQPDPKTQQIQAVLAFTITCLYLFGARLSMQMRLLDQFQRESHQTQQVAQRSLALGEQRLQQTSQALECVAGAMRMDYVRVLQRFVPAEARDDYGRDFLDVQKNVYHLAESIHPSAWRERGLAAALEETIGKALREAGIPYSCETPGRQGLRFLNDALQAAIYRMACEAAVTISASPACIGIHLTLRKGRQHGVPWVVLRVDGMLDEYQVAYGILQAKERQRLAPKLGTSPKTDSELQLLARLFQGNARFRAIPTGIRFTALLSDATSRSSNQNRLVENVRLWAN